MATYDLRVNGSSVDMAQQRIELQSLRVSFRGEPRELTFSQARTHYDPTIGHDAKIELYRDTTQVFVGWIVNRELIGKGGEERIQYRALGPLFKARDVTIWHPQRKVPVIAVNVPQRDDDYDPNWDGLTAGQIIDKLLDTHKAELQRVGIATTAGGTSNLDWVPHNVVFQDTDLVAAIEDLVSDQDGIFWWYDPATGWQFTRVDMVTTSLTITLAQDLVLQDVVRESTEGVWTACRIVGQPQQEQVMLKLSDGTLKKGWDPALEGQWTWDDSYSGASDDSGVPSSSTSTTIQDTSKNWNTDEWKGGTIVLYDDNAGTSQTRNVQSNTVDTITFAPAHSLAQVDRYWVRSSGYGDQGVPTSTTQTTLTDTTKSWVTDQWKGGIVRLVDVASPSKAIIRKVLSNTADTITWAIPHGLADVDKYELWAPGRDKKQYVWRRFENADPQGRTLANLADEPLYIPSAAGIGALLYGETRRPVLIVVYRRPNGLNAYFPVPAYVDVQDGRVYAAYPVVGLVNDVSALTTSGGANPPDDVILIAPTYSDPIMSAYPTGGKPDASSSTTVTVNNAGWTVDEWAGLPIDVWDDQGNVHEATVTSNTSDTITFSPAHNLPGQVVDFQVYGGSGATTAGIRRIYKLHIDDYRTQALKSVMDDAAKLMARSRWDIHRQLSLPVADWMWIPAPRLLNLAAPGQTTGLESAGIPIQAVEYEWTEDVPEATTIHASTDTRSWSGLGDWLAWLRTLAPVTVLSYVERIEMSRRFRMFGPTVSSVQELIGSLQGR